MRRRLFSHLRQQWMGALSLFLVLTGGVAYAGATIGSGDVVDNSLRSVDLKNDQAVRSADVRDDNLTGADVLESSLGQVPSANSANNAGFATNASFANSADSADDADALGGVPAANWQRRCMEGAVKGFARVKGDAANFPTDLNTTPGTEFVDRTFNCWGGDPDVAVDRVGEGHFRVYFPTEGCHNAPQMHQAAIVTVDAASEGGSGEDDFASATPEAGGCGPGGSTWDVRVRDADGGREDATFYIVLV